MNPAFTHSIFISIFLPMLILAFFPSRLWDASGTSFRNHLSGWPDRLTLVSLLRQQNRDFQALSVPLKCFYQSAMLFEMQSSQSLERWIIIPICSFHDSDRTTKTKIKTAGVRWKWSETVGRINRLECKLALTANSKSCFCQACDA